MIKYFKDCLHAYQLGYVSWKYILFRYPYPDKLFYLFSTRRWKYWYWLNDYDKVKTVKYVFKSRVNR